MPIEEITDILVGPVIDLLQQVVDWLDGVSLQAAQGLNLAGYLGYVAVAGPAWLQFVKTAVLWLVLIGLVWVAKAGYRLYLDVKAGVKWW